MAFRNVFGYSSRSEQIEQNVKISAECQNHSKTLMFNLDPPLFFSRRFSRKESTIVMAFRQCFLRPPELTKIVLPKVLQKFQKTPKCTCWPKELNQKGFPRNIQYRTRPKGPNFRFFRHCATFFQFFFIKGFPIHQYFEILKSFCYFWALDMAPTWAVPGLFNLPIQISRHVESFSTSWDFLKNVWSTWKMEIWTT